MTKKSKMLMQASSNKKSKTKPKNKQKQKPTPNGKSDLVPAESPPAQSDQLNNNLSNDELKNGLNSAENAVTPETAEAIKEADNAVIDPPVGDEKESDSTGSSEGLKEASDVKKADPKGLDKEVGELKKGPPSSDFVASLEFTSNRRNFFEDRWRSGPLETINSRPKEMRFQPSHPAPPTREGQTKAYSSVNRSQSMPKSNFTPNFWRRDSQLPNQHRYERDPKVIHDHTTTPKVEDTSGPQDTSIMSMKHPLNSVWSLWFVGQLANNDQDWEEALAEVPMKVGTIEDFWSLFHHTLEPEALRNNCHYFFFKKGIKPTWEDPRNMEGGRWLLTLHKAHAQRGGSTVNTVWRDALLFLIGETMGEKAQPVTGAVFSVKTRCYKIALWLSPCPDNLILEIGKKFKAELGFDLRCHLGLTFELHQETRVKRGSAAKYKFEL